MTIQRRFNPPGLTGPTRPVQRHACSVDKRIFGRVEGAKRVLATHCRVSAGRDRPDPDSGGGGDTGWI